MNKKCQIQLDGKTIVISIKPIYNHFYAKLQIIYKYHKKATKSIQHETENRSHSMRISNHSSPSGHFFGVDIRCDDDAS